MLNERWMQFVNWACQDRSLIGASVFRLISGTAILIEYTLNYAQRHYLFGPEGVWPWAMFAEQMESSLSFSVYAWSPSHLYFEVCFHLGLLVAALWWLGWRTRWTTPLCFVFWWSLHQRFPSLGDGGDNLMQIVFIYAFFANVGAHFSLDSRARARTSKPPAVPWAQQLSSVLNNCSIAAMALQLNLVYATAGLAKVQGETWREGTALYYALRDGEYLWSGVGSLIYQNAFLVVALSYSTVVFQIGFPFLFFLNRYTRLCVLFLSVLFHVGIALFMGLITFSLFMMAVDLALVRDSEFHMLKRYLGQVSGLGNSRCATGTAPASNS